MPSAHIYLANGFEEVEMISVADILRRAGIETTLVALDESIHVSGAHAITVHADLPFSAMEGLIADAIILPGGGLGTENLLASEALHQRLRDHLAAGKLIAAVCAAPKVLAKAGILQGRKAICYPGCEAALLEGGAQISGFNVVVDGHIITSRGAGTSALFALEIAKQLMGEARASEVGRAMLFI